MPSSSPQFVPAQAAGFEPLVRLGLPWRSNAGTDPALLMVAPSVTKTDSSSEGKKFQAAEPEQEGQRRPDLRLTKD